MSDRKAEIIAECLRQSESCLYTSTSLFLWLRNVRFWNRVFLISPIIVGGIAGFSVLQQSTPPWVAATLALLAGFFPAVYDALKLKGQVEEIAAYGAQFKVLQGRFRQAALIAATGPVEDLENEFRSLMERMDAARAVSLTPPQRFFEKAREEIMGGHYDFTIDEKTQNGALLARAQ